MEHGGCGGVSFPKGWVLCQGQAQLCALPSLSTGVEAAAREQRVSSCLAWCLQAPELMELLYNECVPLHFTSPTLTSCLVKAGTQ